MELRLARGLVQGDAGLELNLLDYSGETNEMDFGDAVSKRAQDGCKRRLMSVRSSVG